MTKRLQHLKSVGDKPMNSTASWRKKTMHKRKSNGIKTIEYAHELYCTDFKKANPFSNILAKTFNEDSSNHNFNTDFKRDITNKVNITLNGNKPENEIVKLISIEELNETIKRLNNKNSSGLDGISNNIIKNLPEQMKKTILNLFNQ
jgi:hypothetical protein